MIEQALIIEQIASGNQNAFEVVFKEHYEMLCRFAFTYIRDADDAEEIVQNNFVKIWEKREQLNIKTSIKSYLFSAIKNACLNKIKHEKVKAEYAVEYKHTTSQIEDEVEEKSSVAEKIEIALNKLPERCREVFVLSRYEGLKYQEIADSLEISVKTVENQMSKALKILRVELKALISLLIIFILKNL